MATNSFGKVGRTLQNAVGSATKKALGRASISTRALYSKEVSRELGISSTEAKRRSTIIVGNKTTPAAIVSIGTKVLLAAHAFKTSRVKLLTPKGIRYGAVYTNKSVGKLIAPQGIRAKGKNGKIIIGTKISKGKYKDVRVPGLSDAVNRLRPSLEAHMKKSFRDNFNSFLTYRLNRELQR